MTSPPVTYYHGQTDRPYENYITEPRTCSRFLTMRFCCVRNNFRKRKRDAAIKNVYPEDTWAHEFPPFPSSVQHTHYYFASYAISLIRRNEFLLFQEGSEIFVVRKCLNVKLSDSVQARFICERFMNIEKVVARKCLI